MLWSGFVPVYLAGIGRAVALVAWLTGAPAALWLLIPLDGALVAAAVVYRVRSLEIMASEKRLAGLRLSVRPSPVRVGRIIGFGRSVGRRSVAGAAGLAARPANRREVRAGRPAFSVDRVRRGGDSVTRVIGDGKMVPLCH